MSKNKTKTYEGTEHELQARTIELDELHHDVGLPAMAQALGTMSGTSRRTFLLGAGAAVAGTAAVAVGTGAFPQLAAATPASPRRRRASWARCRRRWPPSPPPSRVNTSNTRTRGMPSSSRTAKRR